MHKFPLATTTWDQEEYNAIQKVVDSGIFSMSSEVKAFEEEFANFFGSKYAVMVNSGSSANLLMISSLFYVSDKCLRLNQGDEVIVPAVSWSTTYFRLHQYGLKLKFVDIDKQTLNYDLQKLGSAITSKTRVIFLVNLLGNPNYFTKINSLIKDKNIFLLEDNCESMGAKFEEKYAGTFGVMGTFSLFFSHHISTMEGGVVITEDEELYHIIRALRAHGWTRDLPQENKVTGTKSSNKFEESFKFVLPGYNLRPLEMSGAIGRVQLKKLPEIIKQRRKNGNCYKLMLTNHPLFYIQEELGESSWFGFSLIIREDSNITREDLIEKLDQIGFESRPIVGGNFTKNKVMRYIDHEIHQTLDNADYIDQNGLFVGNHHYPIEDGIQLIKNLRF